MGSIIPTRILQTHIRKEPLGIDPIKIFILIVVYFESPYMPAIDYMALREILTQYRIFDTSFSSLLLIILILLIRQFAVLSVDRRQLGLVHILTKIIKPNNLALLPHPSLGSQFFPAHHPFLSGFELFQVLATFHLRQNSDCALLVKQGCDLGFGLVPKL